jgi:CheY-like chemotaxis protein
MDKEKIMLVEDSASIRKTTKMILSIHGGYDVMDFESAEEAFDALHDQTEVDLIISDVNLPGMSGFDLIEKIKKEEEKYKTTPVLIITGDPHTLELQKLSCGNLIDGWLSKPFDENVLMILVKTYLDI